MSEADEVDITAETFFAIVPEWVLDADISDRAVRLYAVLRRYANVRLMSRPSRAKLAIRMRASLSSVDRALRELETLGAVVIRHRWTNAQGTEYVFVKDADHLIPAPSGYLLRNDPPTQGIEGGLVTSDGTPLVTRDHTVSSPVTTPLSSPVEGGVYSPVTHVLEPVEPKPVKKKTPRSRSTSDDPEGFAEFWAAYPKRVARGTAAKAYAKAIKKADPAEILTGAHRYAADPTRKPEFTSHPATWLNAERWTDEVTTPPSHGGGESIQQLRQRLLSDNQEHQQ